MTLLPLLSDWSAHFEQSFYINSILYQRNLFRLTRKIQEVRIEILVTGTKNEACLQIMADCDDLAVCSKRY